jgi:hypothetical protein
MLMLRALGVALFVVLASAASPALAQTWTEFRPQGADYAIEMPGEWKLTTETINTPLGPLKANMAGVSLDQRAFMTMWIAYPEEAIRNRPVETMLDGARDGAVANVKGTLRNEARIIVSNLPAREIIIDAPNNLVVIQRYFVLRNMLIQAVTAGMRGVETQADTRRFLDSMKVVSP